MGVTPLELAKIAAIAADDKQAEDICVLNVGEISDVCDYLVICSADNPHKVKSIVDEIEEKVRVNASEKPLNIEGRTQGDWTLLDYGCVLVNVFSEESRDYYRLENLWGDAPFVELGLEGEMKH